MELAVLLIWVIFQLKFQRTLTVFIIIASYSVLYGKFLLIRTSSILQRSSPKSYSIHGICLSKFLSCIKILFIFLMVNDWCKQSRGSLFCPKGAESKNLKSAVTSASLSFMWTFGSHCISQGYFMSPGSFFIKQKDQKTQNTALSG